jgi:iron complex outermembrane receptor protein
MFGGADLGLAAGVITAAEQQAMVDYVGYTQISTAGNTTLNYYADLSGEMFELPGGMAAFAIGFESRRDSAFNQPDALVAGGGSSDNFQEPTSGSAEAEEVYVELYLPLLSDVPGAQSLELTAAYRSADYEGSGKVGARTVLAEIGSADTARVGLVWRPIEDLMFRVNWGETFRAPSVSDLYSGGGESFPSVQDPCNLQQWPLLTAEQQAVCTSQGVAAGGVEQPTSQLRSLVGGNPFLTPEQGENLTYGFVWTPSFVENLDIVVDFWQVELEDAQSTFSVGSILNNCIRQLDPGFCPFIERNPAGGIQVVRSTRFNAASLEVEGLDFGVRYAFSTDSAGDFRFSWDTTYTSKTVIQSSSESDPFDWVGLYQGEPNWEYRSNLTTNWQYGDFTANWTMRYLSELEEDCWIHTTGLGDIDPSSPTFDPIMCSDPERINLYDDMGTNFLGARLYHDLQVTYATTWDAVITVGARNLFGKEPPLTQNSFAHSFDAAYDLPDGAFWYVGYRQTF